MLKICELFKSIQGETSYAGLPAMFIRLSGCNLSCGYCDTEYARTEEGRWMDSGEITGWLASGACNLVVVTGGEPLLQEDVHPLMAELSCLGYKLLLETNGSLDISRVPEAVSIIMDMKCPGSGMSDRMRRDNLAQLKFKDELKFVIASREDYLWARQILEEYRPDCHILLGTVFGKLSPRELAQWMLADRLKARLQLQLHKYIWEPSSRGV